MYLKQETQRMPSKKNCRQDLLFLCLFNLFHTWLIREAIKAAIEEIKEGQKLVTHIRYADDSSRILLTGSDVQKTEQCVEHAKIYNMKLNATKTEDLVRVVKKRKIFERIHEYTAEGRKIKEGGYLQILGCLIDSHFHLIVFSLF